MKIKITLILFGFLLAGAQAHDFVNWAGHWDVQEKKSGDICYPDTTILIEQSAGQITASWVWEKTQACIQAKIAGQKFIKTVQNPGSQGKSIGLKLTTGEAGTFTINKDQATFESQNGASASYLRRHEYVYRTGTWDIVTQDKDACLPDKSITMSEFATSFTAEWTWANSSPCRQFGVAGNNFYYKVDSVYGNDDVVSFKDLTDNTKVERLLTVVQDQAIFSNSYGAAATFVRRQELVNWVGTWDFVSSSYSGGCYPQGSVTILPAGDKLVVSWIWETDCDYYGLSGESFSQTLPVPKAGALTLHYIARGIHVSGILRIKDDQDKLYFTCHTGSYATLKRRPQMVNWAGAWEIATQDKTACYPEGPIAVTQTPSDITFSWIWDKTAPCLASTLAGSFTKTISIPSGNSAQLDISTTLSVLFTVFHDGAIFSTNGATGGASTYNRKQENVKFAGTWNIQNQQAGEGCFPDTSVIITQDVDSITAEWTWADSIQCQNAGLAGNEFIQTEPTPRGRAIFLDILVQTTRVSGIFSINGDQATFARVNEASATFVRESSSDSPTDPENDTPTEPSKEPSTDSKSGSSTGIIAIIIIVVLAIGAYFYVQKTKSKKLQEDLNVSLSGIYAQH